MMRKSFLPVVVVLLCAVALFAQQAKVTVVSTAPSGKAPSVDAAKTPAKAPAKADAPKPPVIKEVDGDQAYKANCTRCHLEPRKFSERKMATIMQHMRVRANMTEAETQAILRYLTK